ncbi:hypothetical protein SPOG_03658 [Schizosaccharomyces cryophilus OY26]|uniref:Uncharacterized protein n=1 Tax=Schizosaccharomyces cryophilus (strain OY26 / ATCC MYA-4695 / CBS 11777 / NBRC 106824 / NRRL Y48691) TaxID=653667 RepID=S9X7N2_SCHCR|nr:uncharacterized protein SPOG_03658 [Schizosaccharomyces cryophilus OY26]EPY53117.1 hypothetical protein SPOG_03658 [Schizosaccharomyces cryophilus OY26]
MLTIAGLVIVCLAWVQQAVCTEHNAKGLIDINYDRLPVDYQVILRQHTDDTSFRLNASTHQLSAYDYLTKSEGRTEDGDRALCLLMTGVDDIDCYLFHDSKAKSMKSNTPRNEALATKVTLLLHILLTEWEWPSSFIESYPYPFMFGGSISLVHFLYNNGQRIKFGSYGGISNCEDECCELWNCRKTHQSIPILPLERYEETCQNQCKDDEKIQTWNLEVSGINIKGKVRDSSTYRPNSLQAYLAKQDECCPGCTNFFKPFF